MRGIICKGYGGHSVLTYSTCLAKPEVKRSTDVLIKVEAASLNRADILQRKGHYPPPFGTSEILGLDIAGYVVNPGLNSTFKEGDPVMALVSGGGYGEFCIAESSACMHIPKHFSFADASAIPEVFLTAYQTLRVHSSIQKDQLVLVHAGASGVGNAICQLAKLFSARCITTSSSEKVEFCKQFADFSIPRSLNNFEFSKIIASYFGKNAVNVIVDPVFGNGYLDENIKCLAYDGSIVILSFIGGHKLTNFSALPLSAKAAKLIFSTLRGRDIDYKAKLISSFINEVLPAFESEIISPVVGITFPIEKVSEAHCYMESNKNCGKIVLLF